MYYSDYNRPPEDREPIIETDQFQVHDAEPPKKKKKGGFGKLIAVGLCCAVIGGAVGGGGVWAASRFGSNSTTIYEGNRPTAVSLANVDGKTVLSAEEVYASNLGAVVGVNGNVTTNVWGQTVKNAVSGSGFVISSNATTSYILTNYHVIDGVSDIKVMETMLHRDTASVAKDFGYDKTEKKQEKPVQSQSSPEEKDDGGFQQLQL